jgi:hypothetical protein
LAAVRAARRATCHTPPRLRPDLRYPCGRHTQKQH